MCLFCPLFFEFQASHPTLCFFSEHFCVYCWFLPLQASLFLLCLGLVTFVYYHHNVFLLEDWREVLGVFFGGEGGMLPFKFAESTRRRYFIRLSLQEFRWRAIDMARFSSSKGRPYVVEDLSSWRQLSVTTYEEKRPKDGSMCSCNIEALASQAQLSFPKVTKMAGLGSQRFKQHHLLMGIITPPLSISLVRLVLLSSDLKRGGISALLIQFKVAWVVLRNLSWRVGGGGNGMFMHVH